MPEVVWKQIYWLTVNTGGCMDSSDLRSINCDDGSCLLPSPVNLFFSEYGKGVVIINILKYIYPTYSRFN